MIDPTRSTLTAGDVMTANPRTCSPFSSVLEAVMIFRDANCAAVPVVDAGVTVGVLTDRDVALASADDTILNERPVSEIMCLGGTSVTPDTPLEEVREKLEVQEAGYLLVVDAAGQLRGIITASDVARTDPDGTLAVP